MHFHRQALARAEMKSRRDCLGQQEFLCCNHSLSMQKPISHKRKEEEEEEEDAPGRSRSWHWRSSWERKRWEERGLAKIRALMICRAFFCDLWLYLEVSELQNQGTVKEGKVTSKYVFPHSHRCIFFATTRDDMCLICESCLNPWCPVAFPMKTISKQNKLEPQTETPNTKSTWRKSPSYG